MANLFRHYTQEENRFTNGLLSILQLSLSESNLLLTNFFKEILAIEIFPNNLTFKVLQGIVGTADGEISNDEAYFLVETKISSGALRKEQVQSHLKELTKKKQKLKRLILLTPDDSASSYVKQFTQNLSPHIVHLEWKRVYNFLKAYAETHECLLSIIISQYLAVIQARIFAQDIAAVIVKIDFGERSGVFPEDYLDEMEAGEWDDWHTPRMYKHLDGKGRKLILYDRTRQALTVEVEIQEVKKRRGSYEYPWSNQFVPGTLKIYRTPIPATHIRKIEGLEKFGIKERSAIRIVTQEQYRALIGSGDLKV